MPADLRPAANAVKDKFARLLAEREELRAKWLANTAALQDAVAAGRFFGVEVDLPPDMGAGPVGPIIQEIQRSLFEPRGDLTIRELVLEELANAGKDGIKAAKLRRIVEARIHKKLHPKTIGMTLYRLSDKGQARREGYTWFSADK